MEKTKRRSQEETIAHLTKYLNNDLGEVVGAKLVSIRSANAEEAELLGWELHDFHPIPILEFDNGNALILSSDEEGNSAGFAFILTRHGS